MQRHLLMLLAIFLLAACGSRGKVKSPEDTSVAARWFERATQSYKLGDWEDSQNAVGAGLALSRTHAALRLLAARLALARLEWWTALELVEPIEESEAHTIRGRAYWFLGNMEQAADELEASLKDPAIRDPWAHHIARLARRGMGRRPFAMTGGLVATVEMPRAGPMLIVPCELEGENVLALIATANGEVVIDSSTRKESAWVNFRFGSRFEVRDVPALVQDLSGISRQLGVPIRAIFGSHFLRRTHVTWDRRGDQFVLRQNEPPAPPAATRIPLSYAQGSTMLVVARPGLYREGFFLLDSLGTYPLALEGTTWRGAGIDPNSVKKEEGGSLTGILPFFKWGALSLPQVPTLQSTPVTDTHLSVQTDILGSIGVGILSIFRVTLGEEGRFMWIEADSEEEGRKGGSIPLSITDSHQVNPEGIRP